MNALIQEYRAELLARLDWDLSDLGTVMSLDEMRTHGTTVGGIRVDHGQAAVAFSDGKMSVMDQAWGKDADKVLQIDDHSCFLISGSAAVGIEMAKALRSWIAIIENSQQFDLTARSKVNFVSEMLKRNRPAASHGMGVMPLLVTYDRANTKLAKVFMFTMDGMWLDEDVFVFGSGHHAGHSSLKMLYRQEKEAHGDVSLERGIELAKEILNMTKAEDNASGGKQTIKIVDAHGVRRIEEV